MENIERCETCTYRYKDEFVKDGRCQCNQCFDPRNITFGEAVELTSEDTEELFTEAPLLKGIPVQGSNLKLLGLQYDGKRWFKEGYLDFNMWVGSKDRGYPDTVKNIKL